MTRLWRSLKACMQKRTPHNLHPDSLQHTCNVYCEGDRHAVIILTYRTDGQSIMPQDVLTINAAYFNWLGWRILAARPAEADPAALWAQMAADPTHVRRQVAMDGSWDGPCPLTLPRGAEVWRLTVEPLW